MPSQIKLFNTLTRSVEEFVPLQAGQASIYACGPTVYHFAHIGNLRTYIFEDLLKRTLIRAGYKVKHVMNVTDVGHLQSDADTGEDKMSVAAQREAKSPWDIARFYEDAFLSDCKKLQILSPDIICRATDHVPEMIRFVETLEAKGFAYQSGPNVYFDTTKFDRYGDFARLPKQAEAIARVDEDDRKRHPRDFVLWFALEGSKFPNQIMKWDSPWGEGFPGWHIECSAMATKYLGEHFDIHCGGIDHVPVHHTNEIAQSEACLGHKWVNYWLHGEFLNIDNEKMSKSAGDFLTLQKLIDDGFDPLEYRYLCASAHYRGALSFSYESLQGAKQAYETLCHKADEWRAELDTDTIKPSKDGKQTIAAIDAAMADDLNSPVALSILWEAVRNPLLSSMDKLAVLDAADAALGFGGLTLNKPQLTPEQQTQLEQREQFRRDRNWAESDRIRLEFAAQGIMIKDRPEGMVLYQTKAPRAQGAHSADCLV